MPAGIFQGLDQLGGLPLLIDEAHTVPNPRRVELAAYGFANGQRYTVGGADGKTRGGGSNRIAVAASLPAANRSKLSGGYSHRRHSSKSGLAQPRCNSTDRPGFVVGG
ncbi:MAG: hypothetical protein EI684_14910 [Candidatus Viridilinea halotolerans]|uniref:Uncharacterized protein n=1 Tax=Candidatus Viridilinea halotolerans TaxID=2491704 RepID=A0A426TW45_9CHLR|nr:MAG: hypothetical protein EI684_14910 [Candidatus Viridilinea halotolerans]